MNDKFKNNFTINNLIEHARELLRKFKGENYVFGNNCLSETGKLVGTVSQKVSLVISNAEKAWKQLIDEYMGPVLEAAKTGDFSLIKNVEHVGTEL